MDTCPKSPYAQAIDDAGLSRQRANRMEALANVPEPQFEAALADPVAKPTVSALLERARNAPAQPKIARDALRFWGILRDFEREDLFSVQLETLLETMTSTMRDDMRRLLPRMLELFERLEEQSRELA